MSSKVVFTGLYRHNSNITNLSLENRLNLIRENGIDEIYWYVWRGEAASPSLEEIRASGIEIREIDEPFPHVRGIGGRRRQIFNIERALQDFNDDDIILKLRWDIDFNDTLIKNISSPAFFDPIEKGVISHKVWTAFYNIQELFSTADPSFAGYCGDLRSLINFDYSIGDCPSTHYISHDGMMLMPSFLKDKQEICDLIYQKEPYPNGLMFQREHYTDIRYLEAWAFSYYLLHKYFKTGPLGTSFFKRGDVARWPYSIVDYDNFKHNYDTIIGDAPKLGLYPRYRVYDDIFVQRLVSGEFKDPFGSALCELINNLSE